MNPAVLWLLSLLLQAPNPQRVSPQSARAVCSGNPVAPSYSGTVDLSSYVDCNATNASGPWSARLTPDGQELFVTLAGPAGSFGIENCVVARLDAAADVVNDSFSVGLFPEEVAWVTAGQTIVAGFVTDSSDGTVTVFDGAGQPIDTIVLPDPLGFGSCFPFGIVTSPDQLRVHVGTLDGSGNVYAIDTTTLSVEEADTLVVPGAHGRLAFHKKCLVVPVTEYDATFTSSVARVVFVDPADPDGAVAVALPSPSTFPSAQDVAVRCDGRVFVAGLSLGSSIHVLDARTRSYVGAIPSTTSGGLHQGLALSPEGLLALADYASEEIAFFDSWTGQALGLVALAGLSDVHVEPEELVFSADGKKLWAICNASDSVAIFETP
jgi:DNA-binding beta-propeller fold protein YncE